MDIMIDLPKLGLYRHFKGSYYFLCNILHSEDEDFGAEYFNVLHPEYGHFIRSVHTWDTDVSNRTDNVTGQIHRFERIVSLDDSIQNFTTDQLIHELSVRKDSPLQDIDYPGLNKCVVAVDYVVGQEFEATDTEPKGVFVHAAFSREDEAKEHWSRNPSHTSGVYKRTFLKVD